MRSSVARRHRRSLLLAIALVGASAAPALASSPADSGTLTTSATAGGAVTTTWTGTLTQGVGNTVADTCLSNASDTLNDHHALTVAYPASMPAGATVTLMITNQATAADTILQVTDGTGHSLAVADAGVNAAAETVTLTNPPAGQYDAISCTTDGAGPYTASATLTTTIAAATPPGGPAAPPVAPIAPLTFTAATVVDPILFGGEPGLNFDTSPSGVSAQRSFVDWPVSSRQNIGVLFRSTDGGVTYHKRFGDSSDTAQGGPACDGRQVPTCGGGGGGDTDVHVDPVSGNLIYGSQEALASQLIGTSTDHGTTFPTASQDPVVGKDATAVDRQWSGSYSGTNTIFLAYHIPLAGEFINRSDSNGATGSWTIPAGPQIPSVTQSGSMIIDNTRPSPGFPAEHPIYIGYLGTGFQVGVSLDGAKNFVEHTVPGGGNARSFTKLNVDRQGNLYATWVDSTTQKTMLSTSLASDPANAKTPATKWTAPIVVNTAGLKVTIFSDVVAGDDGRIAISYYGTTANAATPDAVTKGSGGWTPYVSVSTNALCQSDATPCAAPTFTESPIAHQINQDDNICTSGTACAATMGNRNLLDYFDISLDSAGHLGFVWSDTTNDTTDPFVKVSRQATGPSLYAGGSDANLPTRTTGNSVVAPTNDALYPVAGAKILTAANQPALDLTGTSVTLKDAATMRIRISLADASKLAAAVPGGGTSVDETTPLQQAKYLARWDFGGHSYYAGANVPAGSATPTFFSGTVNTTEGVLAAGGGTSVYGNSYTPQTAATGSIVGNDLVIDVPTSAVGTPATGSRLISFGSYSIIGPDDAAVLLNTLPITVDATPTMDTTLAAPNAVTPTLPEVAAPVLLLLAGLLAFGGLTLVRRRVRD